MTTRPEDEIDIDLMSLSPEDRSAAEFHGQLDLDSSLLRDLIVADLSNPEIMIEWLEAVDRLRENSAGYAAAVAARESVPESHLRLVWSAPPSG
jgi:hypothetical protein